MYKDKITEISELIYYSAWFYKLVHYVQLRASGGSLWVRFWVIGQMTFSNSAPSFEYSAGNQFGNERDNDGDVSIRILPVCGYAHVYKLSGTLADVPGVPGTWRPVPI